MYVSSFVIESLWKLFDPYNMAILILQKAVTLCG